MKPGYDFNSTLLKEVDLFDGERTMDPATYQRLRSEALAKVDLNRKLPGGVKDVRTPEQKTSMMKDLSKVDKAEYARILKSGNPEGIGANPSISTNIKNKRSFNDQNGRRIDFIETKTGALSIQFFFNDEDNIGIMFDAIMKKFGTSDSIIPKTYKRAVNILSALKSVCIFLPPQPFAFGFKTYLMKEIEQLVK